MENVFNEDPSLIYEIRQGIERECLRVDGSAKVSTREHPVSLGSKLTHANITTDYSEHLLEFITNVHKNTEDLYQELEDLHGFTQLKIDDEYLWPNSMPAMLPHDAEIPLAYYGESNVGKLKTLYRKGLGFRYGRSMQSIAGLHYNFSLSDAFWEYAATRKGNNVRIHEFKNRKYFRLIRNFQRYRWLLVYLFGASSAVNESFLEGKTHNLERLNHSTFYTPTGTSLRMGGLGYTSSAQIDIGVCFNQLTAYIETLEKARLTPYTAYENIGLKKGAEYLQLNTNLLQIDNEFYSAIRPKNIARTRESALKALHLRGIEYIEVRLLDIDPFHHLGMAKESTAFMHLFLLWCLESESPFMDAQQCKLTDKNFATVVSKGRDPKAEIEFRGKQVLVHDAAKMVLNEIETMLAKVIQLEDDYAQGLQAQHQKIDNPQSLPSNRLLEEIGEHSFVDFNLKKAIQNKAKYTISPEQVKTYEAFAKKSWEEQKRIESEDKLSFDDFLKEYFANIKIS